MHEPTPIRAVTTPPTVTPWEGWKATGFVLVVLPLAIPLNVFAWRLALLWTP